MRAAVFHGVKTCGWRCPGARVGPGEVKLRVLYNGICGSDLHEYYDGPITTRDTPHPLTGVKNPVIRATSFAAKSSMSARESRT